MNAATISVNIVAAAALCTESRLNSLPVIDTGSGYDHVKEFQRLGSQRDGIFALQYADILSNYPSVFVG